MNSSNATYDKLIKEAKLSASKKEYELSAILLQSAALEMLTSGFKPDEDIIYHELKKEILSNTNYSEYHFPALVDKGLDVDYLYTICDDFLENANTQDVLLTIFLVTYNQEDTIAKAIESVICQKTQFKYKILLLEDCSTDSTLMICKQYEKMYPDIIEVIAQPSNTFNNKERHFRTALRTRLTTPYWTALEGDDYWIDEYKIQNSLAFLEKNSNYVGVGSNCIYNDLKTGKKELGINFVNFTKSTFTITDFVYLHTTTRFYRNIINFNTIPTSRVMSDTLIFFEYLMSGSFYFYNKVTGVYNIGTGIWTSLSQEEQKQRNKVMSDEFVARALEKYKQDILKNNLIEISKYLCENGVISQVQYMLFIESFIDNSIDEESKKGELTKYKYTFDKKKKIKICIKFFINQFIKIFNLR